MFKVNNVTPCYKVSIVKFEYVITSLVISATLGKCSLSTTTENICKKDVLKNFSKSPVPVSLF